MKKHMYLVFLRIETIRFCILSILLMRKFTHLFFRLWSFSKFSIKRFAIPFHCNIQQWLGFLYVSYK